MTENKTKPYSRGRHLKEAIFGTPKVEEEIVPTKTLVLGAVEQSYGVYQTPSFRDQVTVFWDDPLIKESITMFGEKVCSTGFYLTGNPQYTAKLPITGHKGEFTALEAIKMWCDLNNIDIKILDIAIEMKAFGNSFWRITDLGFVKIPIEAVWHMVRIAPNVPLQDKYNVQLQPIYGGKVIPWGEFVHFRTGVTGYHAPLGQGVIYSLLMKPKDSEGKVCPSIYDIRLGMRNSLNMGFRKFSFGNELWSFKNMSNEDFEAEDDGGKTLGQRIADMSSTGNRIATNAEGSVDIAVPDRTQSYDMFIKQMNDEFFMSLADPSLKLGLEMGFTKATAETATDEHQFKVSTSRRTMKQQFEDLFKQILTKLGFDALEANIQMNFGPEESATYVVKDIWDGVKNKVITPNEARILLSKFKKWEITGDIAGGDKPLKQSSPFGADGKGRPELTDPTNMEKKEKLAKKSLKEAIEIESAPQQVDLNINIKTEPIKTDPLQVEIKTDPLKVDVKSEATIKTDPIVIKTETLKVDPIKVNVKSEATIKTDPIIIKNEPVKVEVEVKQSEKDKTTDAQRLALLKKAVDKIERK